MSTREDIKVTYESMQRVHHLIEQCLLHYMTQNQVIHVLKQRQNIHPIFTESVWQILEDQNPEFFKSYHLRLILQEQITVFNNLLAKQAALIYQTDPNRASYPPMFNVSHMPPMPHNNGSRYVSDTGTFQKMENKHVSVPRGVASGYNNGGSSMHSGMQCGLDRSTTYSRRVDVPSNMASERNSSIGMMQQGMRGVAVKREPGYVGNSRIVYYESGANVRGPHPANCTMVRNLSEEVSSPFTTMVPNSPPLEDDTSSEFYRQIIMATDFTNRSGPSNHYRM